MSKPAIVIGLSTLVVATLMVLTNMRPQLVLIAALGALIGWGIWFAVDLDSSVVRSTPMPLPRVNRAARSTDSRLVTLRWDLDYGGDDDRRSQRLHQALVELVDDQLAVAHGINRSADPAAAHEILGRDLARFVEDPDWARSVARRGKLGDIVARIEAI